MLDADMVRDGLAWLADKTGRSSQAHGRNGWRLQPVVDEATLARAERAIGMPLPDEYRHFLTTLGDGGTGPYYGVMSLAKSLDTAEEYFGSLDPLGSDCPLTTDIDFGEI